MCGLDDWKAYGYLLLKQWGRIGTDGCKIGYDTEALAIDALRRQSQIKTRRGYA
jgi:hypothetical protein